MKRVKNKKIKYIKNMNCAKIFHLSFILLFFRSMYRSKEWKKYWELKFCQCNLYCPVLHGPVSISKSTSLGFPCVAEVLPLVLPLSITGRFRSFPSCLLWRASAIGVSTVAHSGSESWPVCKPTKWNYNVAPGYS